MVWLTALLVASSLLIASASTNFLPDSFRARLLDVLIGTEVDGLIQEELKAGSYLTVDDLDQIRDDFMKSIERSDMFSSGKAARLMSSERHLLGFLSVKRNPFTEFISEIKAAIKKYLATKYEDCFMGRLPSLYKGPTETVRDLNIRKTSDYADHMRSIIPDLEVLGVVPDEGIMGFGEKTSFRGGNLKRTFLRDFVDIERRCSLRFSDNTIRSHFFPEIRALVQEHEITTSELQRIRQYPYTVYVGDSASQSFSTSRFAHFWVGPDGNLRCRSEEYIANGRNLSFIDEYQKMVYPLPPTEIYLRVFSASGNVIDRIHLEGDIHDQVLFDHGYKFPSQSDDFAQLLRLKFADTTVHLGYDSDRLLVFTPKILNQIILVSGTQWIQTPFSYKYTYDILPRPFFCWDAKKDRLTEAAQVVFKPQQLALLAETGGIYVSDTKSVYVSRLDAAKLMYVSYKVQVFVDSDKLDQIWLEDAILGSIALSSLTSQISRIDLVGQMLSGKPQGLKQFLNHVLKGYHLDRRTVFDNKDKALKVLQLNRSEIPDLKSIADVTDIDFVERIVESTIKSPEE